MVGCAEVCAAPQDADGLTFAENRESQLLC